ncbi:unnamed protein product [Boreogadus saida]
MLFKDPSQSAPRSAGGPSSASLERGTLDPPGRRWRAGPFRGPCRSPKHRRGPSEVRFNLPLHETRADDTRTHAQTLCRSAARTRTLQGFSVSYVHALICCMVSRSESSSFENFLVLILELTPEEVSAPHLSAAWETPVVVRSHRRAPTASRAQHRGVSDEPHNVPLRSCQVVLCTPSTVDRPTCRLVHVLPDVGSYVSLSGGEPARIRRIRQSGASLLELGV